MYTTFSIERIFIQLIKILVLLSIGLYFNACGAFREIKFAAKGVQTTLKKGDTLLNKANESTIDQITRKAGKGLISSMLDDTAKVNSLVKDLVKNVRITLNREIDSIDLQRLGDELDHTLRAALDSGNLRISLKSLLDDVLKDVQQRKIRLNVSIGLNETELLDFVNKLRDTLLSKKTGRGLTVVLDKALLDLSKSKGLDSLLSKVNSTVNDVDRKLAEQNKSWWRFVNRIWIILGSLLLLAMIGVGYFFRKRAKYKRLATVLTEGIDQISNRADYDRIVKQINQQADTKKVLSDLQGILQENAKRYPVKAQYKDYADRTVDLMCAAMNGNMEIPQQLLTQAKTDPEFYNYLQDKFKASEHHN